jgi:hypothetical protein
MKKFLFTTLFLGGLALLAPCAHADCQERVFLGYDRYAHPVYQYVSRPRYYRPQQAYYYDAPVRYQSYDYGRGYDYDRSHQSRCRDSRPRISFSFGF